MSNLANDPISQGTSISTSDVDEMHRILTSSSILTYILDFYRSRIFGTTIHTEGTHVTGELDSISELVNSEWKTVLRKDLFDSIVAYGICILRYMPVREKRSGSKPRLKFHVIPMSEVTLIYKKNSIEDTIDFKVYPRTQTFGDTIGNQDPITRTRVLYTEQAFSGGGRIVSLVSLVRDKILLYERALEDASLILSRMTTPDWGIESITKEIPVTAEDVITMETGDSGYGQTAQVYQALRLGQTIRQTEMSRLAAIDKQTHNEYADANTHKHVAHNKQLAGTNRGEATVPIWMERVGYRFVPNERLVTFPVVPLPANIKAYLDSLVSSIGAAFSLSATLILSEHTGHTTMGQAFTTTEQNIKRFVTRYHTLFERFLQTIYTDIFHDLILEDRADKVRTTLTNGSNNVDAIWEVDMKFNFVYVDRVSYDEIKALYEDGIIDEDTYCERALSLYGITSRQSITPSLRSRTKDEHELDFMAKRQKGRGDE